MSIRNSAGFTSNATRWLVALWLLLGTGLAFAQTPVQPTPQPSAQTARIETFHLKHRSAREMMPLLRPLLTPADGMSGTGYTLIVRSTPDRLKQIAEALKEFDQAPARLLITVRQGVDTSAGDSGAGVSVRSDRLSLGPNHHRGNGAEVRIYSTDNNQQNEIDQQLQVSEGQWAHIATGQLVPLPEQSITATQNGSASQQGIRYRAFTSGFEVRPQVSGHTVTLQVRPFQTHPSPMGDGSYSVQSLSTTVSGRLGEWIPLGGQVQQAQSDDDAVTYSTQRRGDRTQRIFIKVQRLQ